MLIYCIRVYQKISKHTEKRCRYYPSCSSYAIKAVGKYGFVVGALKSLKRILRCNPFFKGGFDDIT